MRRGLSRKHSIQWSPRHYCRYDGLSLTTVQQIAQPKLSDLIARGFFGSNWSSVSSAWIEASLAKFTRLMLALSEFRHFPSKLLVTWTRTYHSIPITLN